MKPSVYIETTVIGYLTARPVASALVSGHMAFTKSWWEAAPHLFELFVSELVIDEASAGDAQAAAERLAVVTSLPRLAITGEARELAVALLREAAVPPKENRDALHVAIGAANGMRYLATWNCRHLANAVLRPKIEKVCREHGFEPPLICTPLELMEVPP